MHGYQTFRLGQLLPDLKTAAEGEFYLLIAPDANRNAQVIDVKFIKGDERLKPLASQLKSIKYRARVSRRYAHEDRSSRCAAMRGETRSMCLHDG